MIGHTPKQLVNGFDGFAVLAMPEIAFGKDLLGILCQFDGGDTLRDRWGGE
jgi:hypothetical protein